MSNIISRVGCLAILALVCNPLHAAFMVYVASLDGASEDPANNSAGTGFGSISYDAIAHTLALDINFSRLTGTATTAHLHCCTLTPDSGAAQVATPVPSFPGFPSGVTAGAYQHVLDLTQASSWRAGFITDHGGLPSTAELAFAQGLEEGKVYLNIHTNAYPGGEIRGFLHKASAPEPATLALLGIALIGVARHRRRVDFHS